MSNTEIAIEVARSKEARETRERHMTIFRSVAFTLFTVFALWLAWYNNII